MSADEPADDVAASSRSGANTRTFPIVAIGASTRHLAALDQLFKSITVDGMGYVVILKQDPGDGRPAARLVADMTRLPVREVTEGARVEPNLVLVAPSTADVEISAGVLRVVTP